MCIINKDKSLRRILSEWRDGWAVESGGLENRWG